jgi:D-serine deaminase-like pyridoxal phosphate-dependent protein
MVTNTSSNQILKYTLEDFNRLLENEPCPCAVLDLEAFDHNLGLFEKGLEGTSKTMRIGTKSLRVPALIDRCLKRPGIKGVFVYHPNEIAYLHDQYGIDDFIVAYPIAGKQEAETCIAAVKSDPGIKLAMVVDAIEHLQLLQVAATAADVEIGVIVDVDMGINFMGVHAGVLRTPLREPGEVVAFAKRIKEFDRLSFKGILGYEGQEAGIREDSFIMRRMKKASRPVVIARRAAVVTSLESEGFHCEIVNAGGSGSFRDNLKEACVTEIAAGSGLFKPHSFDPFKNLEDYWPAMFMALRVVRRPSPGVVTAFSGGFVSSGDRLPPKIVLPVGCSARKLEGFGEVQTPVILGRGTELKIGDIIVCRLAKGGEPLERFTEVLAVSGGEIVARYPTYRGVGVWGG